MITVSSIISTKIIIAILTIQICILFNHKNQVQCAETSNTNDMKTIFFEKNKKIENFIKWFTESHGGYISPKVTIGIFDEFGGGYGLLAQSHNNSNDPLLSSSSSGNDNDNKNAIIKPFETLFVIPKSFIKSVESIVLEWTEEEHKNKKVNNKSKPPSSSSSFNVKQTILDVLGITKTIRTRTENNIEDDNELESLSLEDQDVILALSLMKECVLGTTSKYFPYMDILPMERVPRLDTFTNHDLQYLNDDIDLINLAHYSYQRIQNIWERISKEYELLDILRSSSSSSLESGNDNYNKCISFDSFHKYISIISSRSMVLNGKKYLCPLADMANYAPRTSDSNNNNKRNPFLLYHVLLKNENHDDDDDNIIDSVEEENNDNNNGSSVIVRADRYVQDGEQIFEDYGDTDNSLFLEAHGFVPYNKNPYHCATIPSKYLPSYNLLSNDAKTIISNLNIIPKYDNNNNEETLSPPSICVEEDGYITDTRSRAYFAIVGLDDDDTINLEKQQQQRNLCLQASQTSDYEYFSMHCFYYHGHENIIYKLVQQAATWLLDDVSTTIEEDEQMLLHSSLDSSSNHELSDQSRIAIQFRLADKKLLWDIIHDNNNDSNSSCNMEQDEATAIDTTTYDNLVTLVDNFNTFIDESLNITNNKIKAKITDNMRLGAVATSNIKNDDIYFSISSSSTINIDTKPTKAVINEHDRHENSYNHKTINTLLHKYYDSSQDTTLSLFLLYETFVLQNDSFWWPYLSLLPTYEELENEKPLFFSSSSSSNMRKTQQHGNNLDYLFGSDVRLEILSYQNSVSSSFQSLSLDSLVTYTLGHAFTKQNFYWARAIIDSRSIWWDGKRHLVPLLDLVNCKITSDNRNNVHETYVDHDSDIAHTRASQSFLMNEQIFENYGQPNYIYFMYHGFTLQNYDTKGKNNNNIKNPHDCALITTLSIQQNDYNAMKQIKLTKHRLLSNGFASFNPTFCINGYNITSLNSISNFIRIKHSIGNEHDDDNIGLSTDVSHIIEQLFIDRLKRLEYTPTSKFMKENENHYTLNDDYHKTTNGEKIMMQLAHDERDHFRNALDILKEYKMKK